MKNAEIEAYLREHLPYELLMLRYTGQRLLENLSPLNWNAHYESFVVHARNLYKFLTNDEDVQAGAFARDFRARRPGFPTQKLNAQVLHLSAGRPIASEEKLQTSDVQACLQWIESEFAKFLVALPPSLSVQWAEQKSKPPADAGWLIANVGQSRSSNTTSDLKISISEISPSATNNPTAVGSLTVQNSDRMDSKDPI